MTRSKSPNHRRKEWDTPTRERVIQMRGNRVSAKQIEAELGVPVRTQFSIVKARPERRKRPGRPLKPDSELKSKRRKKQGETNGEHGQQPKPKHTKPYAKLLRVNKERRAKIERLNSTLHCPVVPTRHFHSFASLNMFHELCSQTTSKDTYPLSDTITSNIPIYDAQVLSLVNERLTVLTQDEWHHILLDGPGVFVIRGMYPTKLLDTANTVFDSIIHTERNSNAQKGDHFSANNSNSRIWNSFGKHGSTHPRNFLDYYSHPLLERVCKAWLGPAYCVTAQVNIVNPGGAPQVCHRDYHLGFQSTEACGQYPAATQMASQFLTLQAAVAHSDMPIESGPTRFIPFSQQFAEGYMAYRRDDFKEYFEKNHISLPLKKGDGIFFNPAVFHAAGENTLQGFERKANLLQVSSAFGKPMENVDTVGLIVGCWSLLRSKYEAEGMSEEVEAFVKAVAEGYPFPTNLDKMPPGPGGLAPESEQELVFRALKEQFSTEMVKNALTNMRQDSAA